MSKTRLETADELCALIERLLQDMPPAERERFWVLMTSHPENEAFQEVVDAIGKEWNKAKALVGILARTIRRAAEEEVSLEEKLRKHRRPRANAERDAEIMRLHDEGKTAGQIVQALKNRWPLTDRQVTAVISRTKKQRQSQQHGS